MTDPNVDSAKAGVQTMGAQTGVQTMIEQIVKSLVDEPGKVVVNLVAEPQESVLELEVAPCDVGKVIGKHGRTIRAMRTLLSASGVRANQRFGLEIIEEEEDPETMPGSATTTG